MPNPLFLAVMKVTIHEYNSYSPKKKERFQKLATQKLGELHETDINAYSELTDDVQRSQTAQLEEEMESLENEKEFE